MRMMKIRASYAQQVIIVVEVYPRLYVQQITTVHFKFHRQLIAPSMASHRLVQPPPQIVSVDLATIILTINVPNVQLGATVLIMNPSHVLQIVIVLVVVDLLLHAVIIVFHLLVHLKHRNVRAHLAPLDQMVKINVHHVRPITSVQAGSPRPSVELVQ
jgi:hypothetical protein